MLGRIYELREAVAEFLEQRGRRTMCRAFKSEHFQLSLAYLADIFEALNSLNLKLQGANANVMAHYDIVQGFIAKIFFMLMSKTFHTIFKKKPLNCNSTT
ncbi:zinc finger protein [Trichinella spiralis]|uniref:zinc finger protein n=1 Tax=Trichinella spiralis TaxID=6334 RepID=UPI0001EFD8DB|nr:zinc finger protein [Trichinella spiralis]